MTEKSDLAAKLQAVIWHGQDLSGDGRAWLGDLIASGEHSLVPRARAALDAFVVLRNFYGRDLMAELLTGLLGVAAFPAVMDALSVDIGDDRDQLTAMAWRLIDDDPGACSWAACSSAVSASLVWLMNCCAVFTSWFDPSRYGAAMVSEKFAAAVSRSFALATTFESPGVLTVASSAAKAATWRAIDLSVATQAAR